jgi:DNA polymerase-3 subunit epsilon
VFRNLIILKPLAVLDVKATGPDPGRDRLLQVSAFRFIPDGWGETLPDSEHITSRFNPGIPIPPGGATANWIRDEDVAGEPSFRSSAGRLAEFLAGCDLCGFDLRRSALRVLAAEMARAGVPMALKGRKVIDPMMIFRQREGRSPATAVRFYCGQGAGVGVPAAVAVLDAQLDRYDGLGCFGPAVDELHELQSGPGALDVEGRFRAAGGVVTVAFGRYAGRPLDEVRRRAPGFLRWMLRASFLPDAKEIAYEALGRDPGCDQ